MKPVKNTMTQVGERDGGTGRNFRVSLCDRLVWGVLFLMPLVFSPLFHLSYEMPKMVLFRVVVLVMFWIFVRGLVQGRYKVGGRALMQGLRIPTFFQDRRVKWLMVLFFLVLGFGVVFSVAPRVSFWGSYYRMHGAYTFLHYLLFFLVLVLNFHESGQWEKAMWALLFGALVSFSYGIVQLIGLDFSGFDLQASSLGRVFSGLGDPSYFSSYIALVGLPLVSFLIVKRRWRLLGVFVLLSLWMLFETGSRSGVIGLGVGAVLFLSGCGIFLKKKRLAFVGLFVIFLMILVVNFWGRFDLEGQNLRSVESRFSIWNTAIDMSKDRPIFGHGFDTFSLMFPKYTDGSLVEFEGSNVVPDRAHNNFLDIVVQTGFFGLMVFVMIFGFFVKRSFEMLRFEISNNMKLRILGLWGGLTSLMVAHFFAFSMTVHFVMIVFFLGYLCFLLSNGKVVERPIFMNRFYGKLAIFCVSVFCVGAIILQNIFPLVADYYIREGRQNLNNQRAFSAFHTASFLYPEQSYSLYWLSALYNAAGMPKEAIFYAQKAGDIASGQDSYADFLLKEASYVSQ